MRSATKVLGLGVAAGMLLLAGCSGGEPPSWFTPIPTYRDWRIVFASDRAGGAGGMDVYLYDISSKLMAAVPGLNSDHDDYCPSIGGGKGRLIAFCSTRTGGVAGRDIYLYDRVDEVFLPLPGLNDVAGQTAPAISGDGRYIAFQYGEAPTHIRLYDRVARACIPVPGLNAEEGNDLFPYVSDTGRFIVFTSDREGGQGGDDIYLYDRSTCSLVDLPGLNSAAEDTGGVISPDGEGRYIAFSSNRAGGAGRRDIYLYDRFTSTFVDLSAVNSAFEDYQPCLTDVGPRFIAFVSNRAGGSDLYFFDRANNALVNLIGLNSAAEDLWPRLTLHKAGFS